MDQSNSGTWYTKHFGPIDMDKSHNYHIVLGIGYLVSSNEGSIVTKKEESERIFMWKIHKFCIYTRRSSQDLPKCWLISLVNLPLCLFSLRRPISPSPISTCHTPPPQRRALTPICMSRSEPYFTHWSDRRDVGRVGGELPKKTPYLILSKIHLISKCIIWISWTLWCH